MQISEKTGLRLAKALCRKDRKICGVKKSRMSSRQNLISEAQWASSRIISMPTVMAMYIASPIRAGKRETRISGRSLKPAIIHEKALKTTAPVLTGIIEPGSGEQRGPKILKGHAHLTGPAAESAEVEVVDAAGEAAAAGGGKNNQRSHRQETLICRKLLNLPRQH